MIVFVDGTERRVVDSPLSRNSGNLPPVYTGEKITLDVVPLKEIEGGSNPAYEIDSSYASDTFKVGIGLTDKSADSGTFKITYKTDTSAAIDFNATAQRMQDILNDSSMTDLLADSPSGVLVTGNYETGWRILWLSAGAKDDFGSDEINLIPESVPAFTIERAGGTGIQEAVQLKLVSNKAALTTSATSIPAGSMSATEIISGSGASREITEITCVEATAPITQVEEFTAVAVGGALEIHRITAVANAADALDGTYFILPGQDGPVGFWIDSGNTGTTVPAACVTASSRQVEITTLISGDGTSTVAYKIAQTIGADVDFSVTDIISSVVLVEAADIDAEGTGQAGTSGFTITQLTAGSEADNYDGTYFYHSVLDADQGEETIYGYWFSRTLGETPPPAGALALASDLTEISGYALNDSALDMASRIATAITAKTGVTAVQSGTEVHFVQSFGGDVGDGAAGNSPLTGFTVSINGADDSLDGKHFIIWETDGLGGEQSRAFWYNISGEAAPSGTALTADSTNEITTVLEGDMAYEVAEKTAVAMDDLPTFSASQRGTKVRAVSSTGYAFTSASDETSGFTMNVAQSGGSGSDANEVVEISFSDQAISGVYVLGIDIGDGIRYTQGIPWNASGDQIEAAISNLSGIGVNDVAAEGGLGGDARVTFTGGLANISISVTVNDSAINWIEGKRFTLDLNTTSAAALVYGQESVEAILEVEATQGSSYTVKLVHDSITLKNGLIDPSSASPTPVIDYYTSTEVDALIIHHLKTISSLIGGTSADLDGLTTDGAIDPERAVFFYDADNSEYVIYVLKTGTEAENSPSIIRPDDYDGVTNQVYWERVDFNDMDASVLLVDGSRAGTGTQELLGINLTDSALLSVVSGAVTKTQGYHILAAQTGTADDVVTINGGAEGDLLFLHADPGDTITLIHGTGNIVTDDGSNQAVTENGLLMLLHDGTDWHVVAGGGGSTGPTYETTLSSLIGGTSVDLDSVITATLDVGTLQSVIASDGTALVYQLQSGTDAEDAPWIVRGDDFALTTNEKIWKLVAPVREEVFEFFGPTESHVVGAHYGYYSSYYERAIEIQLDLAELPSGSGSGTVGWNVIIGSTDTFSADITQSTLCWRAVADEGATIAGAAIDMIPKQKVTFDLTDTGGVVAGKGAVIHIRSLFSPINQ